VTDTLPPATPAELADRRVGDRYHLLQRIARGGMAEVYRAEDREAGATVAIKLLPATDDANAVARFRREAQAATQLSHPHIVTTHEWGDHDGTQYIAMEYVPGPTLKQLIQQQGALDEDHALRLAAQLADALEFAHGRHIVHRDVKPQNVLLDDTGQAKLTDFGIARVAGTTQVTQTRSVLGTAHYISPEQARGGEVDARTDVYSLGVVLFEMLTGRVPFDADTSVAVALKHVEEPPPAVRSVNPRVSIEAEAVVAKALAKDPAERYQTAAEMRDAVERARTASTALANGATRRVGPAASPANASVAANGVGGGAFGVAGVVGPEPAEPALGRGRSWPKRAGLPVWLVPAVVGAVLIALVFGVTRAGAGGVAVPDVRGMTEDEAETALEDAGLQIDVAGTLLSQEVARGRVISQQPGAGERIDRDGTVGVAISAGTGTVRVPDVVGRTEADATLALRDAGFVTATLRRVPSDRGAGLVIDQSPPGGRDVSPDTDVELTSSAGRPPAAQPPAPVAQQRVAPQVPPKNQGRGPGKERKRD
jgi:serine/threonine-protein kinase